MSTPAADRENTMKAIVHDKYGSTDDVLELKDIDKPVVKDDEVLVRVHAAAVNISDWILMRGVPYIMRMASGLRKPKNGVPGQDIAGKVEAVGKDVKQ
ncbi:MAG: alcohol dehydrogenase catalytic domain-containing protein, partial [Candidatus Promineifilaceae bacterium]